MWEISLEEKDMKIRYSQCYYYHYHDIEIETEKGGVAVTL
jgi:hypothetical protein